MKKTIYSLVLMMMFLPNLTAEETTNYTEIDFQRIEYSLKNNEWSSYNYKYKLNNRTEYFSLYDSQPGSTAGKIIFVWRGKVLPSSLLEKVKDENGNIICKTKENAKNKITYYGKYLDDLITYESIKIKNTENTNAVLIIKPSDRNEQIISLEENTYKEREWTYDFSNGGFGDLFLTEKIPGSLDGAITLKWHNETIPSEHLEKKLDEKGRIYYQTTDEARKKKLITRDGGDIYQKITLIVGDKYTEMQEDDDYYCEDETSNALLLVKKAGRPEQYMCLLEVIIEE